MKYFVFCFVAMLNASLLAQNDFIKTLGTTSTDEAYSIQITSDGNLVVAGFTTIAGFGKQVSLTKMTTTGNVIWAKHYGGDGGDFARAVINTTDGGFALVGSSNSFTIDSEDDIYVIKTDSNGNLLWSKTYGSPNNERGFTIIETNDGGYFVGGSTAVFDSSNDAYAIKIDANGNYMWDKVIGIEGNDNIFNVIQLADDHFITVGTTDNLGGSVNFLVNKIASTGNVVWSKTIGGFTEDHPRTVQQAPNGNLIFVGHTLGWGTGDFNVMLLETDANINVVWAKTYGFSGTDFTEGFRVVDDGILIGSGIAANNGGVALLKTDFNGNLLWTKSFDGNGSESLPFGADNPVLKEGNNHYLVGRTNSMGVGGTDMFIIKTSIDGAFSSCDIDVSELNPTVTIANPTTTIVNPSIVTYCDVQDVSTIVDDMTWQINTCTTMPPPTPNFQTDTTHICANTCIDFFDASQNEPTQWLWTFEGGTPNTSTEQHPAQICYPNTGYYDVSLTVSNAMGSNTIVWEDYVTVINAQFVACSPVPVSLLDFTAQAEAYDNLLTWHSATEVNNQYYSIYSSLDGKDFDWLVNITAKGNSNAVSEYQYQDYQHFKQATIYYQLFQTDQNGTKSQIGQTYLRRNPKGRLTEYIAPNPTTDFVTVQLQPNPNANTTLKLFNSIGQVVQQTTIEQPSSSAKLSLRHLCAGNYLLQINQANCTESYWISKIDD